MSLLWIVLLCVVALVWVLSVVDIVRQHYFAWTTARTRPFDSTGMGQ